MSKSKEIKTWSTPFAREEQRPIPCALCGGGDFRPHFTCGEGDFSFFYVRCGSCGLVQINPQPSPAAVAARYGEEHGGDYLEYETANEKAFLRLQELALGDAGFFDREKALLSGGKPRRVLDIGCATGALLETLKTGGWETFGVEISKPQAEYCRGRGLEVYSRPLEENRFPGESFDVILASHLIEHLNNPGAFVQEVCRILKRGGCFYITTPDISGLQARLFQSRWRSAIFDHLYLFSAKTLTELLERSGFSVEKRASWGGLAAGTVPPAIKTIVDRAAKRFGFGDVMILRARKYGILDP